MLRKSLTFMAEAVAVALRDDRPLTGPQLMVLGDTLNSLLRDIDNLGRLTPPGKPGNAGVPAYADPLSRDLVELADWCSRSAKAGGVEMDRQACAVFSLALRNMASRSQRMERLLGLPESGQQADLCGGVVPAPRRDTIDQLLQLVSLQPAPPPAGGVA